MSNDSVCKVPEEQAPGCAKELAAQTLRAEALERQNHHLAGIHETTLILTRCHTLPELMEAMLSRLSVIAPTPHAYVALRNNETDALEIKLGVGRFRSLAGRPAGALGAQAYETGQPVVIGVDQPAGGLAEGCAMAAAPIRSRGEIVGVVGLAFDTPDRIFDEEEVDLLRKFADSASLAYENAAIHESSRKLNDELKTLYEVTLDLTSLLDTEHVLNVIISRAASLAGATSGYVYLRKPDTEVIEVRVGLGLYADSIGYIVRSGEGLAGKVWQTAESMVVNDYQIWEGRHPDPKWDSVQAIAGIPLKVKGEAVGLIGLVHTEIGRKFRPSDLDILHKLADLAVLSLNNAILFEQIKNLKSALVATLEETIQAVAYTVEIRDPYTAGHQRRVACLACAIAKKMNLPQEQIKGIEMAATIHDIGKLYVPSELLSKPTRLMDIEFNVIRHHAQAGYDILKGINFPWPIATVVYQHHEKMNGTGYPRGLHGDEIILESRIVAVADVVEAISSHRPYRPSLGFDTAIEEISAKRGTEYDPVVVDACIEVLKEGILLEGVQMKVVDG
ncbi:MAG: Cyclic di-GMP phosphodiesterase response regulator RpfG [Betaproteobacteria bacterium ADurb.Bin341]|nr:MAG: Cyclic di-GMP phosphodiesterase response regulator RpfG [Betaproteobacteria bacterium ADurb.Bin341]